MYVWELQKNISQKMEIIGIFDDVKEIGASVFIYIHVYLQEPKLPHHHNLIEV